jgi:adenylate cyclase
MLNDLPMGFGKMQKLRVLNVHNNNLRTLPPDIWGCGSLERLNASSNLIQHFEEPPDDLVGMMGPEAAETAARKMSIVPEPGAKLVMPLPPAGQSLLKLYLADNHLNDDIFHQIAEMPNLQVLNLSFNDIYEIPSGTLASVNRLEALYLSGNKLTSLPSEDLDKLQRLTILHLNGNKLQTLPSELGAIKTLQHLDVGSNVLKYNIANWPYDWNW